jgi:signal transduction histidine kinase
MTLLERSADASIVLDHERRILYFNPAYEQMVAHRSPNLRALVEQGAHCYDVFPMSICESNCVGCLSQEKGSMQQEDAMATGPDASVLTLLVTATSDDGYIVETYRNVESPFEVASQLTDQLSRERAANASLEKAVKDRTDQLNAAHDQLVLQEKMSALGRLVAGVAHELNNPINFIYGNVEHLETYVSDLLSLVDFVDSSDVGAGDFRDGFEKRKSEINYEFLVDDCTKLIESVRIGAERSAEIVRDLKNFSRTDASTFHKFDLIRGLESTLNLISPLIKNRIEIKRNYADSIPQIFCNAGHINQVFMNLLTNAAQAIDGEGWIQISMDVVDSGKSVRIQVADSGHGITEEDRAKITDPFFTTKGVGEGSGLGLWITLGIVNRHRGRLVCQSEPGKGAVFAVTLPVEQGPSTPPTG